MESVAQKSLEKAIQYLNINKSRSFVHFLVALNLHPEWKSDMTCTFISLADTLARELLLNGKVNDFFNYFEQALELYPENPELKRNFSKHLQSIGYAFRAFVYLNSAVKLKPEEPLWSKELDDIKNIVIERWHFRMLNDSIRNNAYRCAISQCVDNSSTVLDIGCGSGLLSLYIAENNPKRQVALEFNEGLYNVATSVFSDNQLKNVILLNDMSTSLTSKDISGQVSVLVTEIFDGGFFGEGILQTMIHARKHLMVNSKTDIVIPKSGSLCICALQSKTLARKHCVVDSPFVEEMNMGDLIICNNSHETYDTEDLKLMKDLKYVSSVSNFLTVDFFNTELMEKLFSGEKESVAELKMNSDGDINAFGIWFDLQLCDNVKITTNPTLDNKAKAWEQAVIYLNKPLTYTQNSIVEVRLSCELGKLKVTNFNNQCEDETFYKVPIQIVRLLNDSKYCKACDMAVCAICVHLSQMFSLKDVHVLDISVFPVIGLLLLKRGIQTLTCSSNLSVVKKLILNIATLNGIDHNRILFVNQFTEINTSNLKNYNVYVNNYLINLQEILSEQLKLFISLRNSIDRFNGTLIPYKVRMLGKLIYSEEIERTNRVHNSNVSNYKIAESMNIFQVGQNYISAISTLLSYEAMSNDIVIFEQCLDSCSNSIIDVEIIANGLINAVLCWYEIELLEKWEVYSTLGSECFMDNVLHILELNLSGHRNQKGSLLVCVDGNNLKLALDLDESTP